MIGAAFHGKKLLRVKVGDQTKNLVVIRDGSEKSPSRLFDVHPLVDAINAEHGTNLTVVSHKVADAALNNNGGQLVHELPPYFVVDAAIAYERPNVRLRQEIVFSNYFISGLYPRVVLATGKYQGEKDIALVAQGLTSADFAYSIAGKQRTLREILQTDGLASLLETYLGNVSEIQILVPDDRLIVVPDFPSSNAGLYMPHDLTGIPHGEDIKKSSEETTRNLGRQLGRVVILPSAVSLIIRHGIYYMSACGASFLGGLTTYVNAGGIPYKIVGVVAEVQEADVAKIEAILRSNKLGTEARI